MKKTILYATLLALSFQSCDYLDREPLDSVTKDQYFTTATGTALQQYCNNFYPKLIKGHGDHIVLECWKKNLSQTTFLHGNIT